MNDFSCQQSCRFRGNDRLDHMRLETALMSGGGLLEKTANTMNRLQDFLFQFTMQNYAEYQYEFQLNNQNNHHSHPTDFFRGPTVKMNESTYVGERSAF